MTKSMTGYGKKSIVVEETQIHVEVRTVNHRFLDLSAKIPRSLLFLEERMKRLIKKRLARGRADLFITIEGRGIFEKRVEVDWRLLDQYMEQFEAIKKHSRLTGDPTLDMVSKLEDVFVIQEVEGEMDSLQERLLGAVDEALDQLIGMRAIEGCELEKDLRTRAEEIGVIAGRMEERRPRIVEEHREKIKSRIEEYTNETLDPDQSRVLQEVGLLAEKGDITEELTRLRSHLSQFLTALDFEEPIGRRLDFIIQEMHREVNTIGSKSTDAKVTEWVVSLKSGIEKLKEQVQNVE